MLGVVTADELEIGEFMMEKAGLLEYMDFFAAANNYRPKPSREALDAFFAKLHIIPRQVLFVGDSMLDLEFAKNTGKFLGINGKFPKGIDVIEDFSKLLDYI